MKKPITPKKNNLIRLPLYIEKHYKTYRYFKKGKRKGKLKPNPEIHWITLNKYRNWQHFLSNEIKHKFTEIVGKQVEGKKYKTPIEIVLYYNRNLKSSDYDAVGVIIKFFLDSLVYYGCIEDDNKTLVLPTRVIPIDCEKDVAYASIIEDIDIEDFIIENNEEFLRNMGGINNEG